MVSDDQSNSQLRQQPLKANNQPYYFNFINLFNYEKVSYFI